MARYNATDNAEKMRRVGADAVISPNSIGGLRMASEMIRPTAVSFLDTTIQDRDSGRRIEEVSVPEGYVGKAVSALDLKSEANLLLLAVRTPTGWV